MYVSSSALICHTFDSHNTHTHTHQTKMIFFIFALNYRNFTEEHKLNQHLCAALRSKRVKDGGQMKTENIHLRE